MLKKYRWREKLLLTSSFQNFTLIIKNINILIYFNSIKNFDRKTASISKFAHHFYPKTRILLICTQNKDVI